MAAAAAMFGRACSGASPVAATSSASAGARATVVRRLDLPEVDVVSCHALTPDEGLLALCQNNEEILIFELSSGGSRGSSDEYQCSQSLTKHTQRVTGLAWSCTGAGAAGGRYGRLASCSEDRTAFVWDFDQGTGQWRAEFVELAAPRAALCVAWAPNGERFAVGLGTCDVAICYYRPEVRCWIAMKVGASKASVMTVAWHASSNFLATGSPDGRCTVYDVSEEHMLPQPRKPWGEPQVSEDAGAWVNAVMFSPSGRYLGFLAHDSTARIKDLSQGPGAVVEVVQWSGLPFLRGAFLSDKSFVACGFDCTPVLFRARSKGSGWAAIGSVDVRPAPSAGLGPAGRTGTSSSSSAPGAGGAASGGAAAPSPRASPRSAARGAAARGGGSGGAVGAGETAASGGAHTGVITACAALPGGAPGAERFTTSGADGAVLMWEMAPA